MPPKPTPVEERFWNYIDMSGDCWMWTGNRNKTVGGYGVLSSNRKPRTTYAHRLSWEIHNGPIPEGLWVLHHCDNPLCVNPDHLFLGTQTDNMQDMIAKGRQITGESHANSTLTAAQVRSIREEHANGTSQRILSDKYGVHNNTISRIIRRKRWVHL